MAPMSWTASCKSRTTSCLANSAKSMTPSPSSSYRMDSLMALSLDRPICSHSWMNSSTSIKPLPSRSKSSNCFLISFHSSFEKFSGVKFTSLSATSSTGA